MYLVHFDGDKLIRRATLFISYERTTHETNLDDFMMTADFTMGVNKPPNLSGQGQFQEILGCVHPLQHIMTNMRIIAMPYVCY